MKFLFLMFLMLVGCGSPVSEETVQEDPGPSGPVEPGDGSAPTFASDVKPLLQTYCAECHSDATFISNEAAFLKSKAPTRIGNKSMPPSYSKNFAKWGNEQRAIVKSFVDGQ